MNVPRSSNGEVLDSFTQTAINVPENNVETAQINVTPNITFDTPNNENIENPMADVIYTPQDQPLEGENSTSSTDPVKPRFIPPINYN